MKYFLFFIFLLGLSFAAQHSESFASAGGHNLLAIQPVKADAVQPSVAENILPLLPKKAGKILLALFMGLIIPPLLTGGLLTAVAALTSDKNPMLNLNGTKAGRRVKRIKTWLTIFLILGILAWIGAIVLIFMTPMLALYVHAGNVVVGFLVLLFTSRSLKKLVKDMVGDFAPNIN